MALICQSSDRILPKIVGFYSTDYNKNYYENTSQLNYLRNVSNSEMPFNLNGTVILVSNYNEIIFSNLLKFVKKNESIFVAEKDNIPFACNQMTLVNLCQSGYMQITACLYRNVIFLKVRNTSGGCFSNRTKLPKKVEPVIFKEIPEVELLRVDPTPVYVPIVQQVYVTPTLSPIPPPVPVDQEEVDRAQALWRMEAEKALKWKLKFKQFMYSDFPINKRNTNNAVFGNEEFHCVYKYTLKNHTIFYSADVDGVNLNEKCPLNDKNLNKEQVVKQLNELELVNLDISIPAKNSTHDTKYRKETIWLKAHLNRADKTIVGNLDRQGILQSLTEATIDDMIELGKNYWTPETCLYEGNVFLTFIKKTFANSMNDTMNMPPVKKYFNQMGKKIIEVSEKNAKSFPHIQFN